MGWCVSVQDIWHMYAADTGSAHVLMQHVCLQELGWSRQAWHAWRRLKAVQAFTANLLPVTEPAQNSMRAALARRPPRHQESSSPSLLPVQHTNGLHHPSPLLATQHPGPPAIQHSPAPSSSSPGKQSLPTQPSQPALHPAPIPTAILPEPVEDQNVAVPVRCRRVWHVPISPWAPASQQQQHTPAQQATPTLNSPTLQQSSPFTLPPPTAPPPLPPDLLPARNPSVTLASVTLTPVTLAQAQSKPARLRRHWLEYDSSQLHSRQVCGVGNRDEHLLCQKCSLIKRTNFQGSFTKGGSVHTQWVGMPCHEPAWIGLHWDTD